MHEMGARREHPELKQLVTEASQALARLDAGRLEELALSCQALNRDLGSASPDDRVRLAREAREAAGDMEILARVLAVTRGNLEVLNRLRELSRGRLEYSEPSTAADYGWARGWTRGVNGHGDN